MYRFEEKDGATVKAVTELLRNPPEFLGEEILVQILANSTTDEVEIRDVELACAQRCLRGLFPPIRRFRVWPESQLELVGLHAIELARFHFGLRLRLGDLPDHLRNLVVSYLKKGYDGLWIWERLVQVISENMGISAGGRLRLAEWYACRALRGHYPYGNKWHKKLWKQTFGTDPSITLEPERVVAIVQFEFEFVSQLSSGTEMQDEHALALQLASGAGGKLHRLVERSISAERLSYRNGRSVFRDDPGVYMLYLRLDDPLPTYVGESKSISRRLSTRHKRDWECGTGDAQRDMFVTPLYSQDFAPHLTRKEIEAFMLAVFNPPANNGVRVEHPFDLVAL